jgi:hypothetical protein
MALVYYPLALCIGGCIGYLVEEKKRLFLFLLAGASVLNFWPLFQIRLFSFGEAQFLSVKVVEHFLNFSTYQSVLLVLTIVLVLAGMLRRERYTALFSGTMFVILVVGNIIIPLDAERNPALKALGGELTQASLGQPVTLYYNVTPEAYAFRPVMSFYLPLGSRVEKSQERSLQVLPFDTTFFPAWCYTDKVYARDEEMKQAIFSSEQGIINKCVLAD